MFTLTNSGATAAALKITTAGSAAFGKTTDACTGTSLGPHKSCTVTVAYAPGTPGQSDTGTLTATATATGTKPAATAGLTLHGASAKASPVLATSASAGGPLGTAVTDTATLSGGYTPTGTITFSLYGPSASAECATAAVHIQTVAVTGDGAYSTAGYTPTVAGSYWWTAGYGGDGHNNPAATACGAEQVTLTPLATSHLYWTRVGVFEAVVEAGLDGSGAQTIATGQNVPVGVSVGPR